MVQTDPSPARTLSGQTLTRADIERLAAGPGPARLADCDLDGADCSHLVLSGWVFERCQFRRADFTAAKLEGSRWQSCRGPFANFSRCDLAEATVTVCDFNNGNFRYAVLSSAVFAQSKLTGADFSDAKTFDLRFEETLLVNARLAGLSFRRQRLVKVDFAQADVRKCDFRETVFDDCSLRDALVAGARFEAADLRGADLGGFQLADATLFRGATISAGQAGQLLRELGLNVR